MPTEDPLSTYEQFVTLSRYLLNSHQRGLLHLTREQTSRQSHVPNVWYVKEDCLLHFSLKKFPVTIAH